MINLKELIGSKYKVTMAEEYRGSGDLEDSYYMIISGRRGDIMAWNDDLLEVTVYGVPLKILSDILPEKTHNLALPMKLERLGWKAKTHYDDSTSFLIPKEQINGAIRIVKAHKKRVVTEAMRQQGKALAAKMRGLSIQNDCQ